MVETKVSKTRRLDFTCYVFATCNDTKKLKDRLLSRFAVIELKAYDTLEEFKQLTMDVLKKHPLADYIAEKVYESSTKPNIRDCVRLASMCTSEQDVLRMMSIEASLKEANMSYGKESICDIICSPYQNLRYVPLGFRW
jgi:hypothetical protein